MGWAGAHGMNLSSWPRARTEAHELGQWPELHKLQLGLGAGLKCACCGNVSNSGPYIHNVSICQKYLTTADAINQYKEATDQKLRNVYIPTEALNCTNTSCCDESHRAELNALYNDVMQCMQDASSEVFSDSNVHNNRRGRPGWNDYTNELHEGAR